MSDAFVSHCLTYDHTTSSVDGHFSILLKVDPPNLHFASEGSVIYYSTIDRGSDERSMQKHPVKIPMVVHVSIVKWQGLYGFAKVWYLHDSLLRPVKFEKIP